MQTQERYRNKPGHVPHAYTVHYTTAPSLYCTLYYCSLSILYTMLLVPLYTVHCTTAPSLYCTLCYWSLSILYTILLLPVYTVHYTTAPSLYCTLYYCSLSILHTILLLPLYTVHSTTAPSLYCMYTIIGANFPELTSGTPYMQYTFSIVGILSTAFRRCRACSYLYVVQHYKHKIIECATYQWNW